MSKNRTHDTPNDEMITMWTRSMTDMWGGMMRMWLPDGPPATPGDPGGEHGRDRGTAERVRTSVEAALKNWEALSAALSAPESLQSFFQGAGAMPEMLAKLAQTSFSGFLEIQQKIVERAARMGDQVDAYTFTDIDENLFRTWTDLYEKEFSRFFQVPKLGLVREYQERITQAMDAYNRHQATLNEFLRLLALPVSRSFGVLQEQITELAEKGELPEEGRAYYDMWIKVLEGHYMTLFQTPEYVETLARTLGSLSAFQTARNAVVEDMLSGLPVPVQSEIDELYEEVHRLKRRLRTLEKEKG
jgi:class III poly(R)-hydroxyalkanoic acid synthase PhaE subunit